MGTKQRAGFLMYSNLGKNFCANRWLRQKLILIEGVSGVKIL